MNPGSVIFYLFVGVTIFAAGMTAFSKKTLHASLAVLITVFGLAGLFIFLGSDFLALTLILIYTSVIVVILLNVLFVPQRFADASFFAGRGQVLFGLSVMVIMLGLMVYVGMKTAWIEPTGLISEPTAERLGVLIIEEYVLPLEISSLLLLSALIGAALIIRRQGS